MNVSSTPDPARPLVRAFWVDAFHPGIKSPAEIDRLVADLLAANANTVFVQVRRRGDSYFNTGTEPRSPELQSRPDFDPLAYLLEKAHTANPPIQVHAWLVALPVARSFDLPTDPAHVYYRHGPQAVGDEQWLMRSSDGALDAEGSYFLDPGHPAAAEYLVDVILNVARNYDVDGIHLDYIRYPGSNWGYNPVALRRYATQTGASIPPAPTDPRWQAWRRDQVTALVRQVYLRASALKTQLAVSAATIAWGDGPTSQNGWLTSRTMSDTLQDWAGWMEEGILDLAAPMNYDREQDERQRAWFERWIDWEKDHTAGRHLVIGVGAYLNDVDGTLAQARKALAPSKAGNVAQGVSFYSYATPDNGAGSFENLARLLTDPGEATLFEGRVSVPEMTWKTHPTGGAILGTARIKGQAADGLVVRLSGPLARSQGISGTGFFGFAGLPPGEYRVEMSANGESAAAQVTIAAGDYAPVQLELR